MTRPNLSQFKRLEIRRSANILLYGNVHQRILKLLNWEKASREQEDYKNHGGFLNATPISEAYICSFYIVNS